MIINNHFINSTKPRHGHWSIIKVKLAQMCIATTIWMNFNKDALSTINSSLRVNNYAVLNILL